jgi:transcriptional regulator with XRE-family HTH domain
MDRKQLGTYFKTLRLKSKYSQKEVADACHFTSAQMVSNWERGRCAPPLHAVVSMISLFRVPQKEVAKKLVLHARYEILKTLKVAQKDSKHSA